MATRSRALFGAEHRDELPRAIGVFALRVDERNPVDAGARVALIAKALGLPNAIELADFISKLGRSFHWLERPRCHTLSASKP